MALASMTGFARAEGIFEKQRWAWELRSVNGRGLEMRFRLPQGFDFIEPDIRKIVAETFARGSLGGTLTLSKDETEAPLRVNNAALKEAIRLVEDVRIRIACDLPRAESILSIRGVLEQEEPQFGEEQRKALGAALIAGFRKAAFSLKEARAEEGEALSGVIVRQIDEVERLVRAARQNAAASPASVRDRIALQLAELLAGSVPEDRLAQEASVMAMRADVREELDRLEAHVSAARALVEADDAVGRRFDFLTQEFNREANTLCSKAQDIGLKTLGLDLKTVIDRMREQVQNIE